tara:strand:+ start:86 stop:421 length:336 start_codon:yes stop_codon:yes gene_type:complete
MKPNYKTISHLSCLDHNARGASLIPLGGKTNEVIVNLSDEEGIEEIKGSRIYPKQIRKFLWNNRKSRAFTRRESVLWTAYIPGTDTSILGVGAYTKRRIAERSKKEIISNG